MNPRKLQLNQETLKILTRKPEIQDDGRARLAATRPPVCEMTNFISCNHNC
ncbi:MAG: hypothetical protein LAP21_25720 [Acidobacteriia bacterium]|nr:hypothetical protein [Terriglobia bacterium]